MDLILIFLLFCYILAYLIGVSLLVMNNTEKHIFNILVFISLCVNNGIRTKLDLYKKTKATTFMITANERDVI